MRLDPTRQYSNHYRLKIRTPYARFLITVLIAVTAIPFVLRGSTFARPIVWIFNVFGTVDLLAAITTTTVYNAPVAMGPAYWIPACWVPLLLVTHYVTFVVLVTRRDF